MVFLETEWKLGFWWKFTSSEKGVVGWLSEGFFSKWSHVKRELKIPRKNFKIPDFFKQKYFWENKIFLVRFHRTRRRFSIGNLLGSLHSLLLNFRDYDMHTYYHKDFKGSSQISNEGLWSQFPCLFPMNFVQSPMKGQDTMLLEIQKLGKCLGIRFYGA